MPDLFGSIFSGDAASSVVVRSFILCVGAALVTGIMYFAAYSFKIVQAAAFARRSSCFPQWSPS